MELISKTKCFDGSIEVYSHPSAACNAPMKFSIYLPPQASDRSVPVLYFLAGLTCTEENFMAKAGAQRFAAKHGLILVAPDTSPRNTAIAGEDDDWDFGTGAGFYVDATQAPWNQHYRMYSYIVDELPDLIAKNFPVNDRQGIFGHSMGGHGALICALKNPDRYQSVSGFAPICAPMQCAWGEKAFSNYLGSDRSDWRSYDATELIQMGQFSRSILIDQGTSDKFLADQLRPELFEKACESVGQPLTLRYQEGYDHSYYFIASFVEDHLRFHAEILL